MNRIEAIWEFDEPSIYGVFSLHNLGEKKVMFWIETGVSEKDLVIDASSFSVMHEGSAGWQAVERLGVHREAPSRRIRIKPGQAKSAMVPFDDQYYSLSPGQTMNLKIQLVDTKGCTYLSPELLLERPAQ
ncbi:MAG: hypothetical protein R3F01_02655 [Lysobacteraceae bacterium]